MTGLVDRLAARWADRHYPFLVGDRGALRFDDLAARPPAALDDVRPGDVVALIGDFEPASIALLLHLIDRGAILVPLTTATAADHDYFFDAALVDVVISSAGVVRHKHSRSHPLIDTLRTAGNPGLVLFSSGTTARPKAILHDLTHFLRRYETPRPALRTLNFLLFDHIGGLNTLLHTLFNGGTVVSVGDRTVSAVLEACRRYDVEVLPATPTFLRLLLMSGAANRDFPPTLSIVTYGTERMDQPTLDQLCAKLPRVEFRQTFGMSELGIVRVKSLARDSLFMQIGGEGVETRVVDGVLQIRSASRMLGYLNAPSPFDSEGWYDTKDRVDERDGAYKVVGRTSEVINVGGLKLMPVEVERVALEFSGVAFAIAYGRANPITGQHVELKVEPCEGATLDRAALHSYLAERLQPYMLPRRIRIEPIGIGHRFKKSGVE